MGINNALAGIAVRNLAAAVRWYEQVLARPYNQPMSEVAEWELPHGGWIQVFQDPERDGKSSVTFSVSNLDAEIGRLKALGVEFGKIQESPQVRIAMTHDLDGNQVVFAQPLSDDIAQ